MSDLISREALLKSFDIARMVEYDETGCGVTRRAIPVATIEAAPAIDAVPVVRCKECEQGSICMIANRVWCEEFDRPVPYDGYCHYGAKMDAQED